MTKYAPIWLVDLGGHRYHAKLNADGLHYIVDNRMNKSVFIHDLDKCPVGHTIDYPLFYNAYTVVVSEDVL